MEVISGASSDVQSIEVIIIMPGEIGASDAPKRKRSANKPPKLFVAAASIQKLPQLIKREPMSREMENFWSRRDAG